MLTAWIRFSAKPGEEGEGDRDQAPEDGEPPRHPHVARLVVGGERTELPPEVDGGRGAQRVQLGGLGRQRGGEHDRDEQADNTVRQLGEDEGDEDVVGVLRLGARIGGEEGRLGLAAHGLGATVGLDHGRAGGRLARPASPDPRAPSQARMAVCAGVAPRPRGAPRAPRNVSACRASAWPPPLGLVEEHRRLLELVEDEEQGARAGG